ncbi:hypothetical protein [Rhodothermus marinus]|uniref:VWA domain-containing protein n=1 Tax=Rhodothermus marinus (strain ATCC 43812 / DSM 4252 / R-10) TaxID=518766 RepID=D0MKN4_RHOM4|nr:hypothetical protein [Rhodothermus marinus]ACY49698.1 hypothetical protein Rmar_2831 [Rhodothermus marinus DSM 4252]
MRRFWFYCLIFILGCSSEAQRDPLTACADESLAHESLTGIPRTALVFIDRSSSATASPDTRRAFETALRQQVESILPIRGGTIHVFFVHSRTTGKADARTFVQDAPLPRVSPYDSEQRQACRQYITEVRRRMQAAFDSLCQTLDARMTASVTEATDLWGIFEVISETLPASSQMPPATVLVLSDLLECMPGPERRCFESRPPTSRAQAEAWAREDAERILRSYRIRPEVLRQAHYLLISGDFANREQSRYVRYYWFALLEAFGVPYEQISIQ